MCPADRALLCLTFMALALPAGPVPAAEAVSRVQAPTSIPLPAAAEPVQFYVFSFTDTPVADAAQDLVVGALAYDLTIDPAVEGTVSFRADGWYGGDALLKDFGAALLDQDVALMRMGSANYALIPRANLPMMMARGGVLMTLPEPTTTRPPVPEPSAVGPVVHDRRRWWESAVVTLSIFFAGAIAGAAALSGGQTVYRRVEARTRLTPPPLRLTDQRLRFQRPVEIDEVEADSDLVIPRFDQVRRG